MRPHDMPTAERWPHGVRARYVCGCRCESCRAANTAYARERAKRAKEMAAELGERPPASPIAKGSRTYRRACPGLPGRRGCPTRSHLRRDSTGGICERCRELLAGDKLVSAARARAHILDLSRRSIGRDAVSDASDVARSTISAIAAGRKRRVRASTARRILGVTVEAILDHATVDAAATWRLLDKLLALGWSKAELARRLGFARAAIQIGRERILARTELRVRRLHARLLDQEPQQTGVPCRCARPLPLDRPEGTVCARCECPTRPEASCA